MHHDFSNKQVEVEEIFATVCSNDMFESSEINSLGWFSMAFKYFKIFPVDLNKSQRQKTEKCLWVKT